MQASEQQRKPALGVVFDTDVSELDQVLALALLFGFEGQRKVRVTGLSTSRFNMTNAAFLDGLARFYASEQAARNPLPIGMATAGSEARETQSMVSSVAPGYAHGIKDVNSTADPVALIRNALCAQADQNGAVILAGPPVNLLSVIARPDGRAWVAKKARVLGVAAGRFAGGAPDAIVAGDVAGYRALLAEWPGPIVMAGAELNEALPLPGSELRAGASWTERHPVIDAYRAYGGYHRLIGEFDAPARALAAVLHAVAPDEGYVELSPPGIITVSDNGTTRLTPSPAGRHHYLIARADQKQRVLETCVKLITGQPSRSRPAPKPAARLREVVATAGKLTIGALLAIGVAGRPAPLAGQADDFDASVRPVLAGTCGTCHNPQTASGGLSIADLAAPASLIRDRAAWEKILLRLRAGDMPPAGVRRPPPEQLAAMTTYIERAFERADAATAPDPGRMTAHRLNRNEYANTVRDLLGVRFRADRDFPADDSGDGFDNMGDVLTVSPLLMERYLAAAERIAGWTLSTAMPAKPIEIDYRARDRKVRRIDRSTIEADHRVEFAGEYVVRIGLPGERPKADDRDAAPVTLGFWMDGELLLTKTVETKPSGLVYFDPYSEEELRVQLPPGDHTFRAAFIDDAFARTLSNADAFNRRKNKFPDSIVFVGPYPSTQPHAARAKLLTCNPASGRTCVERIVTTLARRAYRRPPARGEINRLLRLVDLARADGQSVEQGLQLALQAVLVSPHFLFRLERDPNPRDPRQVHVVSPFELASRLSYFLWSSMPDDELLALAESGRLRDPRVLDAQVERLLANPRAAAFADHFAGQWLETRNLDTVQPDPDLFKEWTPELREAMKQETALFFGHVLHENRSVSDFLTADYTFLNERLAAHYGIAGVNGPEFRRVALATDRRGGVLSQAAVLTVSSYPTRTSAVLRGRYVLQNILGMPPAPPPPDVPQLSESAGDGSRSMREQLTVHRSNPACAACHRSMDPLGFGLENYDAIGRWRDADGKFSIDASGTLPDGQRFTSAGDMRALLVSQLPQFSRTLSAKMLTYALQRGLQPYDRRAVEAVHQAAAADGYRLRTMVHAIVTSLPFQSRRGEATPGAR